MEQLSIFDMLYDNKEQTKRGKVKVLSLFSGIGAFEKAFDHLNIPYELVGYCEIDKYASKSYSAIHGVPESMNLGDITKVDEKALPKDIDLITYGFPCQDISLAGKQKGLFNEDGSKTRSGLFFEALRLIEETQPRVAIAENVKNLVGNKFNAQFQVVLASLEAVGYNNYYKVLNAKDYGIPQNRERVFIISIRKDIDNGMFQFPRPFPLEIRLKDVLEEVVDEKFYLKETADYFVKHSFDSESKGNGFRFDPHVKDKADVAKTVTTRAGGRMDDNFVIDIESEHSTFKFDSTNPQVRQIANLDGVAISVTTVCNPYYATTQALRIRKLTPKECFRLMGFDDDDYEKAEAVNSNTQLYKQAGNSIVVPVLEYIIEALFDCGALQ